MHRYIPIDRTLHNTYGYLKNIFTYFLIYFCISRRECWMPDAFCKECNDCHEKFTTFKRKHHCRICGQIFCTKCSKNEIPGRLLGYVGNLRLDCHVKSLGNVCTTARKITYLEFRVCNLCAKAVSAHHKKSSGMPSLRTSVGRKISFETPDFEEPLDRMDLSDPDVVVVRWRIF